MNSSRHDFTSLIDKSWLISNTLFDKNLLHELYHEVHRYEIDGLLNPAGTGRLAGEKNGKLRGDSTMWLDDSRCGNASSMFINELDILRKQLNESLMLGLESVEAHFAAYPAGASYTRHRDRFHDDDSRVLSLVCYLNIDWPTSAGGALRLHLPDVQADIAPQFGTSVMFLSEEVEHEVLPATQTRYSIAAWFRQREMRIR